MGKFTKGTQGASQFGSPASRMSVTNQTGMVTNSPSPTVISVLSEFNPSVSNPTVTGTHSPSRSVASQISASGRSVADPNSLSQSPNTQTQTSVDVSTEDRTAVSKLLERGKQFSSRHKTGTTVGLIFALVGLTIFFAPPEHMGWTGFKEDVETTTSKKTIENGTETTITTKDVSGKTLWDVISLFLAPAALTLLAFQLQHLQQKQADEAAKLQQKQADEAAELQREQADKATREEVLQTYFDRLSTLLIDKNVIAIAIKQNSYQSEMKRSKIEGEE